MARAECPHIALAAQKPGRDGGGRLDRLHRRHAPAHHVGKLAGILAVREHPRIGPEGNRHARAHRLGKALALGVGGFVVLAQNALAPAVAAPDFGNVVPVVDVHHQNRAARPGLCDPRVVNQAGMFDRAHPCADR